MLSDPSGDFLLPLGMIMKNEEEREKNWPKVKVPDFICKRFAMLVEDCKIKYMAVDENGEFANTKIEDFLKHI